MIGQFQIRSGELTNHVLVQLQTGTQPLVIITLQCFNVQIQKERFLYINTLDKNKILFILNMTESYIKTKSWIFSN
jgi:hypothetical protein